MNMTYRPWLVSGVVLAGISLAPIRAHVAADDAPLYGYSAESSRIERQWEEKLRAIPSTENLRAYMQRLRRGRITSDLRTTRTTPSGSRQSSRSSDWRRTSNPTTCSSYAEGAAG